jgi:hypothetical protein
VVRETSGGVVSEFGVAGVTVTAIGTVRVIEPLVPRMETWNWPVVEPLTEQEAVPRSPMGLGVQDADTSGGADATLRSMAPVNPPDVMTERIVEAEVPAGRETWSGSAWSAKSGGTGGEVIVTEIEVPRIREPFLPVIVTV